MASAPTFPTEIWLEIIKNLHGPEVVWLSSSCSRLRALCSKRLEEVKALYLKYKHFKYNTAIQLDDFPYHLFIARILRGELSPSCVVEVNGGVLCQVPNAVGVFPGDPMPNTIFDRKDLELFKEAVSASPWIHPCEEVGCYEDLCNGDEDVALSILIPLLANLRLLVVPVNVGVFPSVIGRIAAATSPLSNIIVAGPTAPLGKLVQVETLDYNNHGAGMRMEELANFAALPSMKRVIAAGLQDHEYFGWPGGVPHSRVSEVYFADTGITRSAVEGFAKGFESPCMMRQKFQYTSNSRMVPEWDHYEISGEVDLETGLIKEETRRESWEIRGPYTSSNVSDLSPRRPSIGKSVFWDPDKRSYKYLV